MSQQVEVLNIEDKFYKNTSTRYQTISFKIANTNLKIMKSCKNDGSQVMINVHYKNASSKAWKGLGKIFYSWDEALNNYKRIAIRSAIMSAESLMD